MIPDGPQNDSKMTPKLPRMDPGRTPDGPRMDPGRTPDGPRTDPGRIPDGPRMGPGCAPDGPWMGRGWALDGLFFALQENAGRPFLCPAGEPRAALSLPCKKAPGGPFSALQEGPGCCALERLSCSPSRNSQNLHVPKKFHYSGFRTCKFH